MDGQHYTHWAWMLRDMRLDALGKWREVYAPAIRIDDLFANHLRRVRLVCDELPEGAWQFAIQVRSRRPQENEWYFWKCRQVAGMYYIY